MDTAHNSQPAPVPAPLSGITAALAGFILNLAAFIALWRVKADIMWVIGVCALLGLAHSFFYVRTSWNPQLNP